MSEIFDFKDCFYFGVGKLDVNLSCCVWYLVMTSEMHALLDHCWCGTTSWAVPQKQPKAKLFQVSILPFAQLHMLWYWRLSAHWHLVVVNLQTLGVGVPFLLLVGIDSRSLAIAMGCPRTLCNPKMHCPEPNCSFSCLKSVLLSHNATKQTQCHRDIHRLAKTAAFQHATKEPIASSAPCWLFQEHP